MTYVCLSLKWSFVAVDDTYHICLSFFLLFKISIPAFDNFNVVDICKGNIVTFPKCSMTFFLDILIWGMAGIISVIIAIVILVIIVIIIIIIIIIITLLLLPLWLS